jgi:hypothetical protein
MGQLRHFSGWSIIYFCVLALTVCSNADKFVWAKFLTLPLYFVHLICRNQDKPNS